MTDRLIRNAVKKDLQSIINLSQQLTAYECQFDETIKSNWNIAEYIENALTKSFVLVAVEEDEIIGYAICSLVNSESYKLNNVLDIEELFVLEEYRSLRVGKQLIEHIIEQAKNLVNINLSVRVSAKNSCAIDFYRNMGFADYDLILEMNLCQKN